MTDQVAKDLLFTETNLGKHLTKHYALWLVLRTTDDNSLHRSGRAALNASESITIQITNKRVIGPWVAHLRMTGQWSGTICEILVECIMRNNFVKLF